MTDFDDTTNVADPEAILAKQGRDDRRDRAYLIVLAGSNVGEMYKIQTDETLLGRSGNADVRLLDDGVSRLHCRIRIHGDAVNVEDLGSRNGTFCNGQRISARPLYDGDKIQLGRTTILKFTYHDQLDESFQQQLFDSALRDGLTRAYNKRYFDERIQSEFQFATRHRTPLALLLMDLDHFKQINDTYGHIAGDKALLAFADHVHGSIRNEDVFARYGGEEFAIISRSISRGGARRFAERLRGEIANLRIEHDGQQIPISCSIGISTLPEDPCTSQQDLVAAADRALYAAKEAGRNRVELSDADEFDDGGTQP